MCSVANIDYMFLSNVSFRPEAKKEEKPVTVEQSTKPTTVKKIPPKAAPRPAPKPAPKPSHKSKPTEVSVQLESTFLIKKNFFKPPPKIPPPPPPYERCARSKPQDNEYVHEDNMYPVPPKIHRSCH